LRELVDRTAGAVECLDLMAGLQEPRGHRPTHLAEPDESDLCHAGRYSPERLSETELAIQAAMFALKHGRQAAFGGRVQDVNRVAETRRSRCAAVAELDPAPCRMRATRGAAQFQAARCLRPRSHP